MRRIIACAFALSPAVALAHHSAAPVLSVAGISAIVVMMLMAASAIGYAIGVARLWHSAGAGRGIGGRGAARFALGWTVLALALYSRIDDLTDQSFAIHMVQHELLMVVAAPLLVTSSAFEAWAWALPLAGKRMLAVMASCWQRIAAPRLAWWLHAAAIWVWHIPALFIAALMSTGLHELQHASFFLSALLFWWAVFGQRHVRGRAGNAMVLLITTMLHTSLLGLLLTFAPVAWYVTGDAAPFGLTTLEDQQLGGLVMWTVGSLAYVVGGLLIVAEMLRPSRTGRRPRTSILS